MAGKLAAGVGAANKKRNRRLPGKPWKGSAGLKVPDDAGYAPQRVGGVGFNADHILAAHWM